MGLDRSTTHRLLSTLERRGLVQRVNSRKYVLGNEAYFLSFGGALSHLVVIRKTLADLVSLTGESASFSILHDMAYHCVLQHASPHDLSYCPTEGEDYPLNAGATGTALLAFQPVAQRERIVATLLLPALTQKTITDRADLGLELERTRQRGYATSAGSRSPGGCAIASPVLLPNGAVLGAVVLSAAEARMPLTRLVEFQPQLQAAAERIGQALEPWKEAERHAVSS